MRSTGGLIRWDEPAAAGGGGSGRPVQQGRVGRNLELEPQAAVELRVDGPVAQVLLEHVVEREAADERVALPAAVGDVAAGDAGAVAVAQRSDAPCSEHARVGPARERRRDVGEGDEAASGRHLDEDPDDAANLRATAPAAIGDRQDAGAGQRDRPVHVRRVRRHLKAPLGYWSTPTLHTGRLGRWLADLERYGIFS